MALEREYRIAREMLLSSRGLTDSLLESCGSRR